MTYDIFAGPYDWRTLEVHEGPGVIPVMRGRVFAPPGYWDGSL